MSRQLLIQLLMQLIDALLLVVLLLLQPLVALLLQQALLFQRGRVFVLQLRESDNVRLLLLLQQ
jgi:hypothetical protein